MNHRTTCLIHCGDSRPAEEVEALRFDYTVQGETFPMAWHVHPSNATAYTVTHVASGLAAAHFTPDDVMRHGLDFVAAAIEALNKRTTPPRMRAGLASAPHRYF